MRIRFSFPLRRIIEISIATLVLAFCCVALAQQNAPAEYSSITAVYGQMNQSGYDPSLFGSLHWRNIGPNRGGRSRSEEHTSELQSLTNLVCRLLLEKKKTISHT